MLASTGCAPYELGLILVLHITLLHVRYYKYCNMWTTYESNRYEHQCWNSKSLTQSE